MSERVPATLAPAPLEGYCERFDDLFTKRGQCEGWPRCMEGLLLPRERNRISRVELRRAMAPLRMRVRRLLPPGIASEDLKAR